MERNKIASYVGFAIKANKIEWGVDNIIQKKGRPKLILTDMTLSMNSFNKIKNYSLNNNLKLLIIENLEKYTGKEEVKALGIYERNLAVAISEIIEGV